jgi:hypothetical protein
MPWTTGRFPNPLEKVKEVHNLNKYANAAPGGEAEAGRAQALKERLGV